MSCWRNYTESNQSLYLPQLCRILRMAVALQNLVMSFKVNGRLSPACNPLRQHMCVSNLDISLQPTHVHTTFKKWFWKNVALYRIEKTYAVLNLRFTVAVSSYATFYSRYDRKWDISEYITFLNCRIRHNQVYLEFFCMLYILYPADF